jgi:adenylate cyclase
VWPRASSFALRDGGLGVRSIGDTLGVAAVVEGSVRKVDNRLRITAQLVDAATGYHIWSQDYDRELEDIFAVQEEIAHAIASTLELRLAPGDTAQLSRSTADLVAYDFYLRGLYLRNNLTSGALRQAMEYFDRAIAREPDFALACAAKASVIGPAVLFAHIPTESGLAEYRTLTRCALELGPTLVKRMRF